MILEYEYTRTGHDLVREFERRYGSRKLLRKRVAKQRRMTRERADLEEWEYYAKRPELLDGPIRETRAAIFQTAEGFLHMLTPERLRILNALRDSGARFDSVHELARALGRDPKNVLNDLKALAEHGLVTLEKRNARRTVPRAAVQRVTITL